MVTSIFNQFKLMTPHLSTLLTSWTMTNEHHQNRLSHSVTTSTATFKVIDIESSTWSLYNSSTVATTTTTARLCVFFFSISTFNEGWMDNHQYSTTTIGNIASPAHILGPSTGRVRALCDHKPPSACPSATSQTRYTRWKMCFYCGIFISFRTLIPSFRFHFKRWLYNSEWGPPLVNTPPRQPICVVFVPCGVMMVNARQRVTMIHSI